LCGIFGFSLKKSLPLAKVFRVLEKLEVHQYPNEAKPVGGYGAGIAILDNNGNVTLEKVGKTANVSPANSLSKRVKVEEASVLVGHVRMPTPKFIESAEFCETAQPYVARCYSGLTVVSAHNGNMTNYKEIREKIGKPHVFESEKVELIDSEVIPHLFEELLKKKTNVDDALDALFMALEGSNTVTLLQIEKKRIVSHFIHKGKTRGLTIWTNNQGEIVFCSRKEPLIEDFGSFLADGGFKEKVSVPWNEDKNLKLSFALN